MDERVAEAMAKVLELLTEQNEIAGDLPARVPTTESPPARPRGRLQQAIVDLSGMSDPAGMSAAEISAEIAYSVTNTYRLLGALARAGVTELVPTPGHGPQRWRLTQAHRSVPRLFVRLAGLIRPGEWTSCADVSIAACGDVFTAWMVCWAAERLPEFPHPHRILLEGGVPHPLGHDHQRRCSDDVRQQLAREGLSFDTSGCALPSRRVPWDQLRQRARRSPPSRSGAGPGAELAGRAVRADCEALLPGR